MMEMNNQWNPAELLPADGTTYDAGDGNVAYNRLNTDAETVKQLKDALEQRGCTLYAENAIGASKFWTYVNEALFVHVMFHPSIRTLRVTYGNHYPAAYANGG